MKTFIIILALMVVAPAMAEMDVNDYDTVTLSRTAKASQDSQCPVTRISDNDKCMTCHAMVMDDGKPKFGLKEFDPFAAYEDRPGMLSIILEDGKITGYVKITQTGSSILEDIEKYLVRHPEIKKLVIELHTPGGSVMDAWRSVGLIEKMRSRGLVVSTRCYGIAASAGVILLVAGDIGERIVSPTAEIMIHKVWTFQMFSLKTPDTAEDQAETLKHFQANINGYILSRINPNAEDKMNKSTLEQCIFKKDFWLTGERAVELGIADKML